MYFEGFRAALARAPEGLLRPGPPADDAALAAAEVALGRPLPPQYALFLRSFDGADLFHESIVILGVGPDAYRKLEPAPEFIFAEAAGGDRLLLSDDGTVIRVRGGSDERWLAGSTFERWLDAALAREEILFGDDGEFLLEAFESDGEELTPLFAMRQAERALRKDPGSAESHHDRGVACWRLGRLDHAAEAFAAAAERDPGNPWPCFDLGRVDLARKRPAAAATAFRRAAEATPGEEGARFLAWAARAAREAGESADADKQAALARSPGLPADLRRALEAAAPDPAAAEEAEALLSVFEPSRRRLPVFIPPVRPQPPADLPRPGRGARPRSSSRRRAPKR